MKTTPAVNTASEATKAADTKNGASFTIEPTQPVPLSKLIEKARAENPDAKTPTQYPTPKPAETVKPATTPQPVATMQPAATAKPADTMKPTTPAAEAPTAQPAAPVKPAAPARSRSEEIDYQIKKSGKMQLINTQLQSLKTKLNELNEFSYAVSTDEDHRYGRISIFDDNNRQFNCQNHGLSALIVEYLKGLFAQKVAEKESELLAVAGE